MAYHACACTFTSERALPCMELPVPCDVHACCATVSWPCSAVAWPCSSRVMTVQWLCDNCDGHAWPCNNCAEWCFWHVEQAIDCVWVLWVHIQFLGYTGVEMWVSKHFNLQLFGSCVTWLSMLLHKDTLAVSQGVLHWWWRFVAS